MKEKEVPNKETAIPKVKRTAKKKTAARKVAKKKGVRKPDGHIIPVLEPEKPKEPEYTIDIVLGYVVAVKKGKNFCLVSIKGSASPVACTIPANRINIETLKGKTIKMEQFTRGENRYFRHVCLAGTGIWHGVNPTK